MDKYKGEVLHSAYWRNVDLKGKKVALVGAGSSAIQILPQIQDKVGHLDNYIRSSTCEPFSPFLPMISFHLIRKGIIPMFAHEVRDAYFGIDTTENPLHAFVYVSL